MNLLVKKIRLLFLVIFVSINCYSQIAYEKGYFINNSNQRIDCLIKNMDWKNNPVDFEYKLLENTEAKKVGINTVKEFAINGASKYIRALVKIDRSKESIDGLSYKKNPVFFNEELFLKVLVEGKSNLYRYEDGNLVRYFFNKENTYIKQLVFKSYRTLDNKIAQNNQFRQQLWNALKCPNISMHDIERIDYKEKDLLNFFVGYNNCTNSEYINFKGKQKRDLFNLTIRLGLNSSSLAIDNITSSARDANFGNKLNFRLGVEAEFIMPVNKNKWSVVIEPTYQYFNSEKELSFQKAIVDYKSIELPIGIRHYFFLNKNNNCKIFINASYILDFASNSKITFTSGSELEITNSTNLGFGVGYKHNDKYSLELRTQTSREVFNNFQYWFSNYNTLSIIIGYSFF